MREGRASTTASLVSFSRGVGLSSRSRDPVAVDLLPDPLASTLRGLERTGPLAPLLRFVLRGASCGMVDHVGLRMVAIDRALARGLASGVEQLVLLGAGLDARAFRVPGLEDVHVFEVDHPATQAYKRERVEHRSPRARELTFVPVDFSCERAGDALLEAGFDSSRPTFWIWEGVTMYLPESALRASLLEVARVSAAGSHLVTTYLVPGSLPLGAAGARLVESVFGGLFGEALVGAISEERISSILEELGFSVADDSDSSDWARVAESHSVMPTIFRGERLSHSIRGG